MINSKKAPEPLGVYPHARRAGNLLFLSGIGPRERGSTKVPGMTVDSKGLVISYSIEEQCLAVFNNVNHVLEAAGAKWVNLIDVTVFLTNLEKDFEVYNRVYREHFKNIQPCRTTIGCSALPGGIAIELKCIAYIS
jgi:2-aminomuconate deaminase